jgi:hypothetical protein
LHFIFTGLAIVKLVVFVNSILYNLKLTSKGIKMSNIFLVLALVLIFPAFIMGCDAKDSDLNEANISLGRGKVRVHGAHGVESMDGQHGQHGQNGGLGLDGGNGGNSDWGQGGNGGNGGDVD